MPWDGSTWGTDVWDGSGAEIVPLVLVCLTSRWPGVIALTTIFPLITSITKAFDEC